MRAPIESFPTGWGSLTGKTETTQLNFRSCHYKPQLRTCCQKTFQMLNHSLPCSVNLDKLVVFVSLVFWGFFFLSMLSTLQTSKGSHEGNMQSNMRAGKSPLGAPSTWSPISPTPWRGFHSASLFPKEPIFPGTQFSLMEYYNFGIHKTKKWRLRRKSRWGKQKEHWLW